MVDQIASGLTLLVPDKPDVERDEVASEWEAQGGEVRRLAKFWRPPELKRETIRIYGPDTFGLVLADIYGLKLLEPAQELALEVPPHLLGREVKGDSLRNALGWSYPCFIKPFVPKAFTAKIYATPGELEAETVGMASDDRVLGSHIVEIAAEARAFVLDGVVVDCSVYEGEAASGDAVPVAAEIAGLGLLPSAVVLDLALLRSGDWVFLEANAAWGAGLNGCAASKVLPTIERASRLVEN